MDIGGARLQTVKISWFESQGALPALSSLGEIRVLGAGFGLVCELEYGNSTFDSESFELELNGSAWDTSGLSFVQIRGVEGVDLRPA